MEKINIEKLGEVAIEYRDGVPFTSTLDPMTACREISKKVNEIIETLQDKK